MAFLETSRSSLPCGTALPFQPEGLVKAGKAGKSSACRLMRAAVSGCHGYPCYFCTSMGAVLRGNHKHEGQARLR
ncbi:hypothetical protein ACRRTK_021687 [Alexandromys fortis]